MKFDGIIIGGGLAGLSCGIRCAEAGLSVAVLSAGMSALHFSSGSIDLLGYKPDREIVIEPFQALNGFLAHRPQHPYGRCGGTEAVEASLAWFRRQAEAGGVTLVSNRRMNHFHITPLGTLKPTFYSQESVFNQDIREAFEKKPSIAVLGFRGFRDFHPELGADNLRRHPLFAGCGIRTGMIDIPHAAGIGRHVFELRSVDLCRILENPDVLDEVAGQVRTLARGCDVVGLPAVVGLGKSREALERLKRLTGKVIYETPTLPPSILGMRLDDALKSRFADLGGVFIAGDKAVSGDFQGRRLDHLHTQNYGAQRLTADWFVLATGSFFSGGLASEFDQMREPVFGLQIDYEPGRSNWSRREFLDPAGHPFLSAGVKTDSTLRPFGSDGKMVDNLFCIGSVLSGYDPVAEGSGGGVAVATGVKAAETILAAGGFQSA